MRRSASDGSSPREQARILRRVVAIVRRGAHLRNLATDLLRIDFFEQRAEDVFQQRVRASLPPPRFLHGVHDDCTGLVERRDRRLCEFGVKNQSLELPDEVFDDESLFVSLGFDSLDLDSLDFDSLDFDSLFEDELA